MPDNEFEEEISVEQGSILYSPTNTTISGMDLIHKILDFSSKHNVMTNKIEVEFVVNGREDHIYGACILRIKGSD